MKEIKSVTKNIPVNSEGRHPDLLPGYANDTGQTLLQGIASAATSSAEEERKNSSGHPCPGSGAIPETERFSTTASLVHESASGKWQINSENKESVIPTLWNVEEIPLLFPSSSPAVPAI